jgi:hypothetical protein
MANKPLKSIKFPGLNDTYTVPEVDATLATTGAAADAKKVGDEISDLKEDLSEILPHVKGDAELVKTIDGYNGGNTVNLSMANSPYVLSDDTFDYTFSPIKKIVIKIHVAGTLSIGTIKKSKVISDTAFDRADVNIKKVFTASTTGMQEIEILDGISLEDEYITIGMPSDTCTFDYGSGTDRGFTIADQSTGKWKKDNVFSLGVTLYVEEKKYIDDTLNDLAGYVDNSDILAKLLHDNIPDTVQSYTFTDGTVSMIEHKNGNNTIRTDTFVYGESSITETRILQTGQSLTIVTNLETLEISVTYSVA